MHNGSVKVQRRRFSTLGRRFSTRTLSRRFSKSRPELVPNILHGCGDIDMSSLQLTDVIWSLPGFEDLKKYCRQSNDFCKDVASILHERAKLETSYGDGLVKISSRAKKVAADSLGTLRNAWESFACQIEQEAEIHKNLAIDLMEQLVKPLKGFTETQKEARKPPEQAVDKTGRNLTDKKSEEIKAKKNAFSRSKESESLTIQLENSRGKTVTDKELSKLDQKCKKAEESVQKTDKEHVVKLIEAERARLKLEATLATSCKVLQQIEEERIAYMKNMLNVYTEILSDCTPKKIQCYEKIRELASYISVENDIEALMRTRGSERQPGEQILFTCYEQDMNSSMDRHRRKLALESKYDLLNKYRKAERKASSGLAKLSSVYEETPKFSDMETQHDVSIQIRHANAVMDCLDCSLYKIAENMENRENDLPQHRFADYIEEFRDKQGIATLILRVPLEKIRVGLAENDEEPSYGLHEDFDDDDDDEFDDIEDGFVAACAPRDYSMLNVCRVTYEYIGAQDDELTIQPGDVITITQKQGEWWQGELNGRIGLFPASYVQEL